MNFYLSLISLILLSASEMFALCRQYQMLQQNSYYPSRYSGWLIRNLPVGDVLFFFLSSLLFLLHLLWAQLVLIVLVGTFRVVTAVKVHRSSIKKLVFTGRIKRLYGTALFLQLLCIVLYAVLPNTVGGRLILDAGFLLGFITPLPVYLTWVLTLPVEKAFTLWYKNDAKKKLRSHGNITVIGITGSYGKTTSKFILTRLLSEKFNVVCTPHSYNTPMGVVRTIRESIRPSTQIFVCEMGAKNKGDIKEICDIVHPDSGLITSVGEQHLETFKTVDCVFATKFELADAVKQKGGRVFVNADSKEIATRVKPGEYFRFGSDKNCDAVISNIFCDRFGSHFDLTLDGKTLSLSSKLLGKHSIQNIAGAVAVSHSMGLSDEDICFAVSSLKPFEHRLELKTSVGGSLLIDDAYNANPEGCLEAVEVLSTFSDMKKVIITPGLIELGEREYDCNFRLGKAAGEKCDVIILVGPKRSKPLADGALAAGYKKENLHIVSSFREAMAIYSGFADSHCVVLLENDLPDNYLI